MDEKNRDSPEETENQVEDTSRYGVHIKRNREKHKKEQEYEPKRKAKASQATSGSFYDEAAVSDGGIPERRKGNTEEKLDVKFKDRKTGIGIKKGDKGKESKEPRKKRRKSSLYFDPVGDTVRKQIHEAAKEDTGAESVDDVVIAAEYTGRVVSVVADGVEVRIELLFKNRKYDTKDVEHPEINADDEGASSKYKDYKRISDKGTDDVSKYDPDKYLERKSNGGLGIDNDNSLDIHLNKASYKNGEKISFSKVDGNRKSVSSNNVADRDYKPFSDINADGGIEAPLNGNVESTSKYSNKELPGKTEKTYSEKWGDQQSRNLKNAGSQYQNRTFEDTINTLESGPIEVETDAIGSEPLNERQVTVSSKKGESRRNKYKSRILDEVDDAALKNREKSSSRSLESNSGSSFDSSFDSSSRGSLYKASNNLSPKKYPVAVEESDTHTISNSKAIQENESIRHKSFDRKYDDAIVKSRFDETGDEQHRRSFKSRGKIADISDVADKGHDRATFKKSVDNDNRNIAKIYISQIERKFGLSNVAYKSDVTANGNPVIRSYKDIDSGGNSIKIRHNKAENRLDDVSQTRNLIHNRRNFRRLASAEYDKINLAIQQNRIEKNYRKARQSGEKIKNSIHKASDISTKAARKIAEFARKNAGLILAVAGAILIIFVSSTVLVSCGSAVMSGMSTYIAGMVPTSDFSMTECDSYFDGLENDIWMDWKDITDNIESYRPGYDEYNFVWITPWHDGIQLMAYLAAQLGEYNLSNAQALMDNIFSDMYEITYRESQEMRPCIYVDEEGNETEGEYEANILTVELERREWDDVISSYLTDPSVQEMYGVYISTGGAHQVLSNPFDFDWNGDVISGFGYRDNPVDSDIREQHLGIDIAEPVGRQVMSPFSGTVAGTGYDSEVGNYIILSESTGYEVHYYHLQDRFVSYGAEVKKGDIIGTVGNTGISVESHLHVGVKDGDGNWLNPVFLLSHN